MVKLNEVWQKGRVGIWLVLVLVVIALVVWSQLVLAVGGGKLTVKILDVGQGDSIYIETPGGYRILVDGGPNNQVVDHLNRELPIGNREIDLLILTHPQEDHLKGLIEVVKKFTVRQVVTTTARHTTATFQLWRDTLAAYNLKPVFVEAGSTVTLSDQVTVKFIWPDENALKSSELNDTALVFKLSYGNFDALFTADADSRVQPYTQSVGDIEVLKFPHHGSKTGIKEDFLAELQPDLTVISVGASNRYGHPAENALEMLEKIGSKIYRTDQNGTVEIVSDGQKWYTASAR